MRCYGDNKALPTPSHVVNHYKDIGFLGCSVCQIQKDAQGRLSGNFIRLAADRQVTRTSAEVVWSTWYLSGRTNYSLYVRNLDSIKTASQPAYMGSDVAALLCLGAEEGDLLVSYNLDRDDVLIVLRHEAESTFTIIGQALLVNGFYLCGHEFERFQGSCFVAERGGRPCDLHVASVDISITPEEGMLLWAQDSQNTWEFDPEAHIDRLRTAVTLHPLKELPE